MSVFLSWLHRWEWVSNRPFWGVSAVHLIFQVSTATCLLENTAGLCMLTWIQVFASKQIKSSGSFIYRCETFVHNEPAGHSLAVFCCDHTPVIRIIFHLLKYVPGASCPPGEAAAGCQKLSASPADSSEVVLAQSLPIAGGRNAEGSPKDVMMLLLRALGWCGVKWRRDCACWSEEQCATCLLTWVNTMVHSQQGSREVPPYKGTLRGVSTVWFI